LTTWCGSYSSSHGEFPGAAAMNVDRRSIPTQRQPPQPPTAVCNSVGRCRSAATTGSFPLHHPLCNPPSPDYRLILAGNVAPVPTDAVIPDYVPVGAVTWPHERHYTAYLNPTFWVAVIPQLPGRQQRPPLMGIRDNTNNSYRWRWRTIYGNHPASLTVADEQTDLLALQRGRQRC